MEAEDDIVGDSLNFIPCLTWIRRGVAKLNPEKVSLMTSCLYNIGGRMTNMHLWLNITG